MGSLAAQPSVLQGRLLGTRAKSHTRPGGLPGGDPGESGLQLAQEALPPSSAVLYRLAPEHSVS